MKTKLFNFFGLCLCLASVLACSEDYDMSKYNPDGMSIMVVSENANDNDSTLTRIAYDKLHTDFEDGDAIGLYAVNGTSVVTTNAKFTLTDGEWIPSDKVVYNPNYTYYAYYPYVSSPYSPSFTESSLDGMFSNFIADSSNKFWKADQSTKSNYSASNLMIAQGTNGSNKTVKFSMLHKRSLAVLGQVSNTYCYADDPNTTYTATVEYTGNIPYQVDGIGYFLMKPNTSTTVGGVSLSGNSGKYVQSYGGVISSGYTVTYSTSTDNGSSYGSYTSTKPSWLTMDDEIGNTYSPSNFTFTLTNEKTTSISKGTVTSGNDTELKAATAVSDRDLSLYTNAGVSRGSQTTANCYLVHAAGTYKLPLVYGNAIKNGSTNSLAYKATSTGSYIKSNLVNHADAAISDPWIKNNSITVDGAKLIWQDAKGLISSVGINGDYLTFTVSSENITEGNAVIAATSSGTVVWSWHIWVTSETLSDMTSIATGSHTYSVAPVNVGWVNPAKTSTIYAGSKCKVKIASNNAVITLDVTQPDNQTVTSQSYGYCPYYQWGRKDAEIPSTGTGSSSHTAYDIDGNTISNMTHSSTSVSIGTTIQNPLTHYYNSSNYGPYSENLYNYWDINQGSTDNITTATVKTVYDPCPPDMCIPTGNLYYYMGNNSSYASWNSSKYGRTWTKDNESIFFPAAGCRGYSSGTSLNGVGSRGYCWSASAYSYNDGRNLYFYSSGWRWYYGYRASGQSVRPVSEE